MFNFYTVAVGRNICCQEYIVYLYMDANTITLLISTLLIIAVVFVLYTTKDTVYETFSGCMRDINLKKHMRGQAHGYGMGMDGLGIGDIDAGMDGYVKIVKDNSVRGSDSGIQRRLKKPRGLTSPLQCTLFFNAYPFIEFYRIDEYDNKLIEIADIQYTKTSKGTIYQLVQIASVVSETDKQRPVEELIREGKYAVKVEAVIPKVAEGDEIYIGLYHQEGKFPISYFGGDFINGISQVYSSPSNTPCVGMYFGKKASAQINAPFINLKATGCYHYIYNEGESGAEDRMTVYNATEDGLVSCLANMDERKRYLGLSNSRANCYVSETIPSVQSSRCSIQSGYDIRVGNLNNNAMYVYELSDKNIELVTVDDTTIRNALKTQGIMNNNITLLRPNPSHVGTTGIYLFRFTVQRPYEVKRFCPDMNYKEFDSRGCTSRLTRQSCMNTVHPRYFPDMSVCKTRVDYGDDDAVYDAHKHRVDVRERRN